MFLVGSYVDVLYNPVREKFIPKEKEQTYLCAREIKEKYLGDNPNEEVINTFQWAKANVQLRYPAAAVEIRRLEADSKFFRSLIIVLLVIGLILICKGAWVESAGCFVLMLASFWRYADQRWKAAQRAYEYLIVLEKMADRSG